MAERSDFRAAVYNEVPNSENEIHGDRVAQQSGFKGGLVPGVTVSAYLAHPAVVAWGHDYLSCGHAQVTVARPLYDSGDFTVTIEERDVRSYRSALFDGGTVRISLSC